MTDTLRMNVIVPEVDDPEIFQYLSNFSSRTRASQARKLMLLGLVQLNSLGGVDTSLDLVGNSPRLTEQKPPSDEQELIVNSGLNTLF